MIKNYFAKFKNFIRNTKESLLSKRIVNLKYNKKYLMAGLVILFTICFFVFDLGGLLGKAFTSIMNLFSNVDGEVKRVEIKSSGYDSNDSGSIKIIKSADWTSSSTANLLYEVSTQAEVNNTSKDVILVLDTSVSMEGARLSKMKTEVNELISMLMLSSSNKVGIVTFGTTSQILSELSNDKDSLINAVNGMVAEGNTNYYQALLNVEKMLENYQSDNRELLILFLADGNPNVDLPNHIGQYEVIKDKYPYAKVYGIDYEPGKGIISSLKKISDAQYETSNSKNILLEAAFSSEYYETFEVIEYVDNNYFYVDSADDVTVSLGNVKVEEENGAQKIVWSVAAGEFKTGNQATMEIDLRLQAERIGVEGLYPISVSESFSYTLPGSSKVTTTSRETNVLKSGYKVKYIANAPASCNSTIDLEQIHYAYDLVELSSNMLSCEGYEFKGWEVAGDIFKINDNTFTMPSNDITVVGKWTKIDLSKTMDGNVYEKLTLYKTIARQAVMDNTSSKYVSSDSGIKFNQIASNTNGKGVYTISSTANDEYPIHYYRGNINNNNVLFANYCWKIVRTTETGGVKIVYNGKPTSDGKCTNQTGASTQLADVAFNTSTISLSDVGYMYNAEYPTVAKPMRVKATLLTKTSSASTTNYYYSQTVSHDGTNYVLGSDATQYILESNYSKIPGYYTCLSTSNTCTKVYYVVGATSSEIYSLELSSRKTLEDSNKMIISSTFEDNEDGTYTLTNPITITKTDWYTDYEKYDGYYTCNGYNITTCTASKWLMHIDSPTNISFMFSYSKLNYLYGNSFTYDGTNYTLKDTKKFWNWGVNYNTLDNHHYTCFNDSGTCSTIYYIHYTTSSNANCIELTGGKSIEDAIDEMLYADDVNAKNSTIKEYIDNTWFASEESGMLDYVSYLEDTKWCNDRTIYELNGMDPNGGSVTSNLYFSAYKRAQVDGNYKLDCNDNDAFTLSVDKGGTKGYGNNALTYPVGLLTIDEIVLSGARKNSNYTGYYLNSGKNYWTLTPYVYTLKAGNFRIYEGGRIDNGGVYYEFGVRPAVSLMPDIEYTDGNGTPTRPYVIATN